MRGWNVAIGNLKEQLKVCRMTWCDVASLNNKLNKSFLASKFAFDFGWTTFWPFVVGIVLSAVLSSLTLTQIFGTKTWLVSCNERLFFNSFEGWHRVGRFCVWRKFNVITTCMIDGGFRLPLTSPNSWRPDTFHISTSFAPNVKGKTRTHAPVM